MLSKNQQAGKLFISYRREDARGIAGRLSDTLGAYFGEQRVFRDIDSIAGGADFGEVIEQSLQTADAVIVLIGPDWLTIENEKGQRRLDDPADWVAQEIAVAMELNKPIFPVLVENAAMPRLAELPDKLKPLTRYNAISISDDRWKTDVLRLGKIISFETPSTSERILFGVRLGISLALFASLAFAAGMLTWVSPEMRSNLLMVSIPYIVIIASALILLSVIQLMDEERRIYIHASIASGAIGCLIFFFLAFLLENNSASYFGAIATGTLMLAFMNISGFKAK